MIRFVQRIARFFLPRWLVGDSLRSQQRSLLRLLAVSHSQRLDPRVLVANLADENVGHYRKKLRRLVNWLAAGSTMTSALRHTPGALSDDETLALQCGIENERLSETFSYLLENDYGTDSAETEAILGKSLAYVTVTACIAALVVTFLLIFIVPTFEQMFEEFGMSLPWSMMALADFGQALGGYVILLLLVFFAVALLSQFEDVRRRVRMSVFVRWMFNSRDHRSASLLRLLSLPTEIGQPLTATLTSAAHYHPDPSVRRRILTARAESSDDAAVWNQLARQRLISRTEAEQLPRIETPSLRAWTMRSMADRKSRRANARAATLAEILQHVPVLIMALFITWVVLAVMMSLTKLSLSLS